LQSDEVNLNEGREGGIAMPSGGEYNFRKKLWLP